MEVQRDPIFYYKYNVPETRLDTRSFPALAVTMVLWAPDTQGPWSAHNMMQIWFKSITSTVRTHAREMEWQKKANAFWIWKFPVTKNKGTLTFQVTSYLNKACTVPGKTAFKPQQGNNITCTQSLFNNGGHGDSSIAWLFTCYTQLMLEHQFGIPPTKQQYFCGAK